MEALKRIRFFDAHPIFAITTPEPFAYGKRPLVFPDEGIISWVDARNHGITVARVGENTRTKLVVFDAMNRKFAFEPMTVAFWRKRFPQYAGLDTVQKILAAIEAEPAWG